MGKNCDGVCTCFPGKNFNCFDYASPADVPEECQPNPELVIDYEEEEDNVEEDGEEEEKDPVDELVENTDDFKDLIVEAFGKTNKFAKLLYAPLLRLRNRMKNSYHRFKCPVQEARYYNWHLTYGLRFNGPCPTLLEKLDEVMKWNDEHVADCNDPKGKMSKKAKSFNKNLGKIKKRMEDKCVQKFKLVN